MFSWKYFTAESLLSTGMKTLMMPSAYRAVHQDADIGGPRVGVDLHLGQAALATPALKITSCGSETSAESSYTLAG